MKRGAPWHRKMKRLARRLEIPLPYAVGLVECLLHLTASQCPAGGIGALEDAEIAEEIGWPGDPGGLVEALVATEWVDRCTCHRLRIHDWPDHADQTVRRGLSKRNQWFARCYDDPSTVLARDEHETSQPTPTPTPMPTPTPECGPPSSPPEKTPGRASGSPPETSHGEEEKIAPQGSLPGTDPPPEAPPGAGADPERDRGARGDPPWQPLLNLLASEPGDEHEHAAWLEETYGELEDAIAVELEKQPQADARKLRTQLFRRYTRSWYRAYVRRAQQRGEEREHERAGERLRADAIKRWIRETPPPRRVRLAHRFQHAGPRA